MTDDRDKLITINEVAKLINIPRSQVLKHRKKLNLPSPVKVLNAYYYRVGDIEEWIARTDVKAILKSIYSEEYRIRVAKEQVERTGSRKGKAANLTLARVVRTLQHTAGSLYKILHRTLIS